MAGITLEQAEAKLAEWMAADTAVASGQAYSVAGRSLNRADAAQIRENITYWNAQVNKLSKGSGGIRIRGGTPL
ncbi:MAG: DUF6148 family protein [Nitrospinota bacterium]|nr:DUF6148 family protein [Nitrospinota bacterium]